MLKYNKNFHIQTQQLLLNLKKMQIEKQFMKEKQTYLYQPFMSTNIQFPEKNGHRFNCKQLHPI